MKPIEQRVEELEQLAAALAIVSMCGVMAALGDNATLLIRQHADENPGLTDPVREILHRLADASEGIQK